MSDRFDVVVVGAGTAGAALATSLARAGLHVALAERSPRCRPCFKAEKVEPDQAELLRKLDLFRALRPALTPIRSIDVGYRGRVLQTLRIEQYGVDYWELVNALRAQLPESVALRIGRVRDLELGGEWQRALLDDGSALEGRLVVLAAGTSPQLAARLGIERRPIRAGHSLAFGFDVELERPRGAAESLTYFSERIASRLDLLTLFPIGARWRPTSSATWPPRTRRRAPCCGAPTRRCARAFRASRRWSSAAPWPARWRRR
jgi:2-polyprenyl-6-methoxyphenol hydroxylase-like FAD-dependent oxidoreductase